MDILCKLGVVSDYYNLIHRHNINHYFLCKVRSFGDKHLTRDETEQFHLSTLKLTWEQAAAKYHMTFVIANDSLDGKVATPERLAEAAAHCGYAFRLARAATERDALVVEIANDGVVPVYHDVRPSLDGVTADASLRGLEPEATRTFRIATPAPPNANAAARLRLLSPKLLPGAELPLARSP